MSESAGQGDSPADKQPFAGLQWSDSGPRPELPRGDDGSPSLEGTPWSRVIFGEVGVLCAWGHDGSFYCWGPVEQIAEAVFQGRR